MSKTYVLLLALMFSIGSGFCQSTLAQHSRGGDQAEAGSSIDNILASGQDSLLMEAFPFLRTLIDLLSQLLDLLGQAGGLLGGGGTGGGAIDAGTIDPGTIVPGTIDPGNTDLGNLNSGSDGSSTIEPGGWGEGPVPSVK